VIFKNVVEGLFLLCVNCFTGVKQEQESINFV